MRKSLYIAVLSVVLPFAVNSAQAHDIGDSFYGRANVKIGYTFQGFKGEVEDFIDELERFGVIDYDTSKSTQGINIGIGYDVYYKLNSFINPFFGLEAQGRIPISSKIVKNEGAVHSLAEYFRFNSRVGAKIIACKYIAFSPYALVGLNVMQFEMKAMDFKKTKTGLSVGAGVETIIKDRFTVGIEYRYGSNKMKELEFNEVKSHNFAVNLGVQFL